jgi:hypothetical protein
MRSGASGFGRFIGREGAGVKATLIGELGIVVDIPAGAGCRTNRDPLFSLRQS